MLHCLSNSITYIPHVSNGSSSRRRAYRTSSSEREKHILSFHTSPTCSFFFIITLFFSLVIISMGPGCLRLTFSVSHTSCVRFPTHAFCVLHGWRCRCLVVSCLTTTWPSPFISSCALNSLQRGVTHSLFR